MIPRDKRRFVYESVQLTSPTQKLSCVVAQLPLALRLH